MQMSIGAKFLTAERGIYNYVIGDSKREICGDRFESGVLA